MTIAVRILVGAFAAWLVLAGGASARAVVDESYCHVDGMPDALRQTVIVIDGGVIMPEPDGPVAANRSWRQFVMQFLDTSDPLVRQRIDARERVSVVVANADGSGVTSLFVGCVPLYRIEEEADLDARTSPLERFFGTDWRRKSVKAGEAFVKNATLAMVEGVGLLPEAVSSGEAFRQGSLVSSLAKTPLVSVENGLPRIILYTDLDRFAFPEGEPAAIRATARADAEHAGIGFSFAEVHVFGSGANRSEQVRHYLTSFVLASRGYLATLTGRDGAMAVLPTPRAVDLYQGLIDFPEAEHPVRLRLARDQNGTLVNSWMDMQAVQDKFVPVFGVLACEAPDACRFIGDNVFAQVWDDNPDPRPDLQPWEPFGGMRSLEFQLSGDRITGVVKDELGYISGREDGLTFELSRVDQIR